MSSPASAPAVRRAQQLRLKRTLWAFGSHFCILLCVMAYTVIGIVEGANVTAYASAVILFQLTFVTLIISGLNLRFREPSMTAAQVFVALWPSLYIMYFITAPEARTVFLLMAIVQLLFGAFVLSFRHLLIISGMAVGSYTALILTLSVWRPQAVDLRIDAVTVFAFAVALGLSSYLGSVIAGLRNRLRVRNRELELAMVELEDLATRDSLTRLPNRRSIMVQLEHEKSRAERRRPPGSALCLCMLDVDHFKHINDNFGHQAGDAVLRKLGETLQHALRQGDFVGRFGGEEFLLLLPESSVEGARLAAERVRECISGPQGPVLPDGRHITVSIGVAVHKPGNTMDATLRRADEALYQAKNNGRNQVVIAPAAEAAPT